MTRHFSAVLRDSKTYQKCKYLSFILILKYTTLLIFFTIYHVNFCWLRDGQVGAKGIFRSQDISESNFIVTILLACLALPCPALLYPVHPPFMFLFMVKVSERKFSMQFCRCPHMSDFVFCLKNLHCCYVVLHVWFRLQHQLCMAPSCVI